MAINKIITLTEEGLNAGPYYDVYTSPDCSTYTLATSSMYLPEVGSTGSVSIPDNTLCIKLVNLSPNCGLNEIVYDFRATTTTTVPVPPPFTTTTTTIAPGPTTTTTTTQGPLPTTTTYGPSVKVVAHSCQNFYDFNTYRVPASPEPQIGGVYTDAYGTCYYITSIPTNQGVPGVGDLTYIGAEGACSSSSCVTTTTTAAPYCNQWTVSNNTGAGYTFKYYYCGQTQATYTEVPAGQSVTVCVQNDRIYNSFNAPLTFTNLNTSCIGTTTTTTLPPDLWRVVAHACQDFYDFNTYGVNKNLTANVNIGDVFKDDFGTCYYVTSIPSDQTLPVVGILTYVGGSGACSSSACVTTTTTQAPFCNTWKVENTAGFGQYFKYQYCGQTGYIYPEVAANSSVTVCVQNNNIFNSFSSSLVFTNLSTVCNATTTTTTTQAPQTIFRAAPCQNIANFNTYTANSSSLLVLGAVMKDDYGTCYQILSFSGTTPVGSLTYLGAPGACTSPQCVTTTTTLSPFCNTWQVENPFGSSYSFKYKYCGSTDFVYPSVPAFSSASFCVQNDQIYNAFGAPLIFTNLSGSCQATTTTTTTTLAPTTTTTTTRAPYCAIFEVTNGFGAGYNISYVYCGQTSAQFVEIPPYTTRTFCVQNAQISALGNPLTIIETTASCNATTTTTTTTAAPTTTTTTTRAPYCSVWNVQNAFGAGYTISYVYCGETGSTFIEIPANTTRQLCVQSAQINTLGSPILLTETTASCTGGITTTTTAAPTTTTTSTTSTTSTTTTTTTIANQKVIIESCEGPGDVTTAIQLAVNGPRLTNGEVVKLLGGFAGLDCYTIANSNWTGSVIYYADVEARFADCASCQSGTTTTTQPPTTTTAAPASTYWRAEWCCDPLKSSIIRNVTGLPFQNMVVWNPEINQCMRALETVSTQSVSYTYDSASYNTYAFGTSGAECDNCISSSLSDGCPEYGIFAACCNTGSTYVVYSTFPEIFTGSYVIYNPVADTCMQFVSSTTASTPDLSITSSQYFTYSTPYGNKPWANTNCIADHNCPGVEYPCISTASIYTNYSSPETNTNVSYLQCNNDGTYEQVNLSYGEGNTIIGCVKSGSIKVSSLTEDYLTDFAIAYTGGICITGSFNTASATADFHMFTPSAPKTITYDYEQFTGSSALSASLTTNFVHYDICMNVTSSNDMDKYVTQSVRPSSMPFFCSGSENKAYYIDVTNVYPFNEAQATMYFSYINESGSLVNDSLPYTGSKTIISQVAGFGLQEPKSLSQEGLTWIIRDEFTGSVTAYPYKGVAAQYTATLKKKGFLWTSNSGSLGFYYEPGVSSSAAATDLAVGYSQSVISYEPPMYSNISNSSIWNMWLSVTPTTTTTSTTTTTTAGPTTTTTTTTAGPTTTTTTISPSIPTGSTVFYDFGNLSSYPGSGSTVFDLSGNGVNGTLVNSPTFSSTNGGILRLNSASSQRINFSGTFGPNVTTIVIWKNVDSTFAKDTGFPTFRGNNGLISAFLGGTKNYCPILFNNVGTGNTYFGAIVVPSDITQWHQYANVVTYSNPNTTAITYLDGNASSATETKVFARSGTGTGTSYLGFDNAVSDRYANGFIMAYLQYNRALTTTELNGIYSYFGSRF